MKEQEMEDRRASAEGVTVDWEIAELAEAMAEVGMPAGFSEAGSEAHDQPADAMVLITPLRRCSDTVPWTIGLSAPEASPSIATIIAGGADRLLLAARGTRNRAHRVGP